ncbi:unnamed protein product [Caenorhabditis auriculariae]|uniref:Uncharacterized protein n=1 Tax=Caenorhabditis auriculariae TaxID=2777116 RepID=A0A8S1H4N8_9PELO|nr:unnamed protein product [Caenorhabditis auriculariae]
MQEKRKTDMANGAVFLGGQRERGRGVVERVGGASAERQPIADLVSRHSSSFCTSRGGKTTVSRLQEEERLKKIRRTNRHLEDQQFDGSFVFAQDNERAAFVVARLEAKEDKRRHRVEIRPDWSRRPDEQQFASATEHILPVDGTGGAAQNGRMETGAATRYKQLRSGINRRRWLGWHLQTNGRALSPPVACSAQKAPHLIASPVLSPS